MKPKLKKLIMSAIAAVILLPGVSIITADAQHRPRWVFVYGPQYPVYYPVYEPVYEPYLWPAYVAPEPVGYLQEWGYKEGRDEGKDDAEDGRMPNPVSHKDYYKSYSPYYRQAFLRGYYDAYQREIID